MEQLLNANKSINADAAGAWNMLASKTMGIILSNLTSDIAEQFKDKITPQTLLEAVVSHYHPDVNQKVDRLEKNLMKLTYGYRLVRKCTLDGTASINTACGAASKSLMRRHKKGTWHCMKTYAVPHENRCGAAKIYCASAPEVCSSAEGHMRYHRATCALAQN